MEVTVRESSAERLYVIGGSILAVAGMLKRSTTGGLGLMLLGGALVMKGLQERARLDGGDAEPIPAVEEKPHGVLVEHAVEIDRPVSQVYGFWRNLENLPRFMRHLRSVVEHDPKRSSWTAAGPGGSEVTWEAEILLDVPDQTIAWRSLDGSQIRNEGQVEFEPVRSGCQVRVRLEFSPPMGTVGLITARLMGEDPAEEVRTDLENFKRMLEGTGMEAAAR